MPRKQRVGLRRDVAVDPKYGDRLVGRFINRVILSGKRGVAERLVYRAMDIIGEKKKLNPLDVLKQAMENIKPAMEVRSRRVGGATYQVPAEVRPERRLTLGFRWLVEAAKARGERSMQECLAGELLDALENRGSAVKKR